MRRSEVREVVHDMRQPLAAMAALVAAVEGRDDIPPDVRWSLDRIKDQLGHLRELSHRVLDSDGVRCLLAIDELVAEVVSDAELAHGRAIEMVGYGQAVLVVGDAVSLRRAVSNLLENACRAAGPRWVRVAVSRGDGDVRVDVSDGGPGFANGPPGSSSLGLTIVHSIARQHGGRVVMDSANPDGATVSIVLPVSEVCVALGTAEAMTVARA